MLNAQHLKVLYRSVADSNVIMCLFVILVDILRNSSVKCESCDENNVLKRGKFWIVLGNKFSIIADFKLKK